MPCVARCVRPTLHHLDAFNQLLALFCLIGWKFAQGYALVEYETFAEAQAAINGANGTTLLEQPVQCDFAFVRPPPSGPKQGRGRGGRGRSASPGRRR